MTDVHGLTPQETAALTRRVTSYSVATASVLVAIKVAAWLASSSIAMLASAADSALDLLAALTTFFAVRYAAAPPDAEHRYGHGKAEGFASLLQAGLVFASAALIGQHAIDDFRHPHPIAAGGWAVGVMVVSIVLTGLLIGAQGRVLRQAASVAVSGDRAHYVADFGSNLIALIGIGVAAWFGVQQMDAVAALAVAALLLWGAIGVFREASGQLMDHELPDEVRTRIVELMTQDPQVTDVHQLRTRAAGPYVHIQMHVDLDPQLTLEAAHEVIVAAEKRVLDAFPAADIIIHADPRGRAEPHGGAFAETHAA
ncbi:MAG: cation transporter [Proteobacteria bacterium]|nr:cation transporter [Pseudomonadota bacterium]